MENSCAQGCGSTQGMKKKEKEASSFLCSKDSWPAVCSLFSCEVLSQPIASSPQEAWKSFYLLFYNFCLFFVFGVFFL